MVNKQLGLKINCRFYVQFYGAFVRSKQQWCQLNVMYPKYSSNKTFNDICFKWGVKYNSHQFNNSCRYIWLKAFSFCLSTFLKYEVRVFSSYQPFLNVGFLFFHFFLAFIFPFVSPVDVQNATNNTKMTNFREIYDFDGYLFNFIWIILHTFNVTLCHCCLRYVNKCSCCDKLITINSS